MKKLDVVFCLFILKLYIKIHSCRRASCFGLGQFEENRVVTSI